jgi:hypothetical protein
MPDQEIIQQVGRKFAAWAGGLDDKEQEALASWWQSWNSDDVQGYSANWWQGSDAWWQAWNDSWSQWSE